MKNDRNQTKNQIDGQSNDICVSVNPGICGFVCLVKARKLNKKAVSLTIIESECKQIQQLSGLLSRITLREIFTPVTRNPVYISAEQTGCHGSCPIPTAILKAAEVALEMALPQDVSIRFEQCNREKS